MQGPGIGDAGPVRVSIKRLACLSFVALATSGCAHHRVPRGGETIIYQLTRCYGRCPAYKVTLGPDGQGIFSGEANTGTVGDRRFRASLDQARAFAAALRKVRPTSERLVEPGRRGCGEAPTDQPSIDVRWQGVEVAAHLRIYTGCRSKAARKLADTLRAAPALLPIADLIGPR